MGLFKGLFSTTRVKTPKQDVPIDYLNIIFNVKDILIDKIKAEKLLNDAHNKNDERVLLLKEEFETSLLATIIICRQYQTFKGLHYDEYVMEFLGSNTELNKVYKQFIDYWAANKEISNFVINHTIKEAKKNNMDEALLKYPEGALVQYFIHRYTNNKFEYPHAVRDIINKYGRLEFKSFEDQWKIYLRNISNPISELKENMKPKFIDYTLILKANEYVKGAFEKNAILNK